MHVHMLYMCICYTCAYAIHVHMLCMCICYTCAYAMHVVPILSSHMRAERVGPQTECAKFTPCTALTSEITAAVIELGADFGVK